MIVTKTPVRIGIDLTPAWRDKSGIVNYTIEITRGILEQDDCNSYYLYCFEEVPPKIAAVESPRVQARVLRPWNRKLWQQTALPILALRDRLNLIFFPGNSASLLCPGRSVATVHDLHPFVALDAFKTVHSGEFYGSQLKSFVNRLYWRRMMKWASRKDRVIAPSQATKNDLIQILGTPADRVDVVPEGVDIERFSFDTDERDCSAFRARHGLPARYLLCVGTHGYKNLGGAIRALALVRRAGHPDICLVIAGQPGAVGQDIHRTVDKLGLNEHVIFTGFFPGEELKHLYGCAELFLFPSFYEGFGLPILEAFACGVPVVSSRSGSLPEVAGDAALLADADDTKEIASAVIKVLNDAALRERMRRLGSQRVRQFSWDRAAAETIEVFLRAMAQ